MKVICVGMSKTGTKTMQCALTDLGYKVYDYMENFIFLRDDWSTILTEGGTTEDFRRMYKDIDAVSDLPDCCYWEEMYKAFPNAKIILMMRESEEVWIKSLRNQLNAEQNIVFRLMPFMSFTGRQLNNFSALIGRTVLGLEYQRGYFTEPQQNELKMLTTYRRHNSYVRQAVPKNKLLVFNVKEGWDPLCDFLGVPVPNKPFPRKNVRGNFVDDLMQNDPIFIRIKNEIILSTLIIAALVSYGIYRGGKFAWFTYNHVQSDKPFPTIAVRENMKENLMQHDPILIRFQGKTIISTLIITGIVSYGIYRGKKFPWFRYNQSKSYLDQFSRFLTSFYRK